MRSDTTNDPVEIRPGEAKDQLVRVQEALYRMAIRHEFAQELIVIVGVCIGIMLVISWIGIIFSSDSGR
jgi:hypothetical protein